MSIRPWWVVIGMAVAAFIGAASVSILAGIPEPKVHDEFSYLLSADTYANLRATNPSHSGWRHFESVHILQKPSYASKYPPAPGLMLGIGQILGGHAIVGVWLSSALMCAAIVWMLQQWLPPRWALIGGILAVLQFGISGYWAQSYWGGAIAATGGALLFGSLRRVKGIRQVASSTALGSGLLLLAFSRPFEGVVVGIPAGIIFLRQLTLTESWPKRFRLIAPTLGILAVGGACGLYINSKVTGEPLRTPYIEHDAQYNVSPLFLWGSPRPEPEYGNERLREFHVGWELDRWNSQQSPGGWLQMRVVYAILALIAFGAPPPDIAPPIFFGAPLFLLMLVPLVRGGSDVRFATGMILLLVTSLFGATYFLPHYLAPVTCLFVFLTILGIRLTAIRFRRVKIIRRLIVPVALLMGMAGTVVSANRTIAVEKDPGGWWNQKSAIETELSRHDRSSLVFVRYHPGYRIHDEWVYNGAVVDEQHIVWAHDLGSERNAELRAYYPDRLPWLLELSPSHEPRIQLLD